MLLFLRVRTADVSLCVLSMPEVIGIGSGGPQLCIPEALQSLVTSSTYFLFNKSDLLELPMSLDTPSLLTGQPSWVASLATGEGSAEFLAGFSKALQNRCGFRRYVFYLLTSSQI